MVLDEAQKKWLLDSSMETNLVERRTAERQARSIAKTGFIAGGNRVGIGYDLLEMKEGEIPEALLREQTKFKTG